METLFACLNQPEKTQWMNEDVTKSSTSEQDPIMWILQKTLHQIKQDPAFNWIQNHPSYDPNHLADFLAESNIAPIDGDTKALAITDAYNEWILKTKRAENSDEAIKYTEATRSQFLDESSKGWLDIIINKDASHLSNTDTMNTRLPPPPVAESFSTENSSHVTTPLPRLKPTTSFDDDTVSLNDSEPSSDSEDDQ